MDECLSMCTGIFSPSLLNGLQQQDWLYCLISTVTYWMFKSITGNDHYNTMLWNSGQGWIQREGGALAAQAPSLSQDNKQVSIEVWLTHPSYSQETLIWFLFGYKIHLAIIDCPWNGAIAIVAVLLGKEDSCIGKCLQSLLPCMCTNDL